MATAKLRIELRGPRPPAMIMMLIVVITKIIGIISFLSLQGPADSEGLGLGLGSREVRKPITNSGIDNIDNTQDQEMSSTCTAQLSKHHSR